MERPEQSSRHSRAPEFVSSETALPLNFFSATVNVSRPGRNPASIVSFPGCSPLCPAAAGGIRATVAAAALAPTARRLAHSQNFIEPRFKVFLSLGPQPKTLDGKGILHRAHPTPQFPEAAAPQRARCLH